jgi:hypothetical protein
MARLAPKASIGRDCLENISCWLKCLDYLISPPQQRDRQAEPLGGPEVDHELELGTSSAARSGSLSNLPSASHASITAFCPRYSRGRAGLVGRPRCGWNRPRPGHRSALRQAVRGSGVNGGTLVTASMAAPILTEDQRVPPSGAPVPKSLQSTLAQPDVSRPAHFWSGYGLTKK